MSISQREESKSVLLNLPEGFHDEIFLKVPAKSILVSRCACKLFFNLLSKPRFIKNHINRTNQIKNNNPKLLLSQSSGVNLPMIHSIPSITSSDGDVLINYPFESKNSYSLDFLGSCNGLICLRIFSIDRANFHKEFLSETKFCILNPLIREFKEFIKPEESSKSWKPKCYGGVTYGFGYDGNIDDYKLVITNYEGDCGYKIDVYTVKSDSWTTIQGMGKFAFHCHKGYSGVFFNGCLHLLASENTHGIWSEVIFSFDVCNEVVVSMPLPENVMPPTGYSGEVFINVGVWGDCIGVAYIWNSVRIDVWVMQEYGVKESWVRKYTTTQLQFPLPLQEILFWKPLWCFNDDGEILVDTGKQIFLYEPKTERVTLVVVSDIAINISRQIYVESIVSLGSGTYLEKLITDEVVKHPE